MTHTARKVGSTISGLSKREHAASVTSLMDQAPDGIEVRHRDVLSGSGR